MTEPAILDMVASGGIGAILSVIIFVMYRYDRKDSEGKYRKFVHDCMDCKSEEVRVRELDAKSRDRHTQVLAELATIIKESKRNA